jgi:hypothetical protein
VLDRTLRLQDDDPIIPRLHSAPFSGLAVAPVSPSGIGRAWPRGASTIDPVVRTPATVCLLIMTRSRQIPELAQSVTVP